MTLTVDVRPDLHARLAEAAAQQGTTPSEFVQSLLEERLLDGGQASAPPVSGTVEARKRLLREWIESNRELPQLPDSVFHRASYYGERG